MTTVRASTLELGPFFHIEVSNIVTRLDRSATTGLGFRRMKAVAPNRNELWISITAVLSGVLLTWRVPIGFGDALILASAMLIGFCCALNAFLDFDEMEIVESYISGCWLLVMLILTPWTLFSLATIREFA